MQAASRNQWRDGWMISGRSSEPESFAELAVNAERSFRFAKSFSSRLGDRAKRIYTCSLLGARQEVQVPLYQAHGSLARCMRMALRSATN